MHKLPYGTRRSLAQQLGFDDAGIRLIDKTSDELQGLLTHLDSLGVSSEKRAAQAQELRNQGLIYSKNGVTSGKTWLVHLCHNWKG